MAIAEPEHNIYYKPTFDVMCILIPNHPVTVWSIRCSVGLTMSWFHSNQPNPTTMASQYHTITLSCRCSRIANRDQEMQHSLSIDAASLSPWTTSPSQRRRRRARLWTTAIMVILLWAWGAPPPSTQEGAMDGENRIILNVGGIR